MGGQVLHIPKFQVPRKAEGLVNKLRDAGFPLIDAPPFTMRKNTGQTHLMFNRGLDGKSSNCFVLAVIFGDQTRVFMTNPAEGFDAANLPYKKIVVSLCEGKERKGTEYLNEVEATVRTLANEKNPNTSYAQMHFHIGSINKIPLNTEHYMFDDGVSSFGACALNLAFAHTDLSAQTMHNNFSTDIFSRMGNILAPAGIVPVPAIEITLPIYFKSRLSEYSDKTPNPNGPHAVLIAESPEIMAEIDKKFLSKNPPYHYAPCTHVRDDMGVILGELKGTYGNKIAIIFAHPVCETMLPQVGLLDRALYGEIPIKKAEWFVQNYAQGVACFNSTLASDEIIDFASIKEEVRRAFERKDDSEYKRRTFNITGAEDYVNSILDRWGFLYGTKPTKNAINMAFAMEMNNKYGTVRVFESDSHNQDFLYSFLLGKYFYWIKQVNDFGMGHMHTKMPEGQRPTSSDFVRLFHSSTKESQHLIPVIYLEKTEGTPKIAPVRKRVALPQRVVNIAEKFSRYLKQGRVLLRDTIDAIMNGGDPTIMASGSARLPRSTKTESNFPEGTGTGMLGPY